MQHFLKSLLQIWSRKVAEILCTFNIALIMQDAAVSLKFPSTQQDSCIHQYLLFFIRIGRSVSCGGDLRYFVFVSRPSIFSLPSASGQYENARLALRVSPLWPLKTILLTSFQISDLTLSCEFRRRFEDAVFLGTLVHNFGLFFILSFWITCRMWV
jgi:hypothetical protein